MSCRRAHTALDQVTRGILDSKLKRGSIANAKVIRIRLRGSMRYEDKGNSRSLDLGGLVNYHPSCTGIEPQVLHLEQLSQTVTEWPQLVCSDAAAGVQDSMMRLSDFLCPKKLGVQKILVKCTCLARIEDKE